MAYYTLDFPPPVASLTSFNPYAMNGGSVVAIAGENYAIIGADTRLSINFSIFTRNQKKLYKLSDTTVLGVMGCWGDALTLCNLVQTRMLMYKYEHEMPMSTPAVAQMLATMLYYKRFFPYGVQNMLAGLDENGKGCVFSFDVVGHCERSMFRAAGTASSLLQPLLDSQVGCNNMQNTEYSPIEKSKALSLLKDGFISATERDIYTGDSVQILTITDSGIQHDNFPLRKD